ncbi:MAG: dihydrolipoyl dehydrogenase [Cellulosilyticaceae bacterium]
MIIKLEKLTGENKTAKVGKIKISVNQEIKANDIILQIETSKGNTPIKSSVAGKITKILVGEGQDVTIGDDLIAIEVHEAEIRKQEAPEALKASKASTGFSYFNNMLQPNKENIDTDVTIIGAGPGGYVAAIYAAKKGLKTVLIEKEKVGGTCLNVGCIPTKAFVKSSEVFHQVVHSDQFGISCEHARVNMKKIVERKDTIKDQLVNGIDYLLTKNGVKVVKGNGQFVDEKTIFVKQGMNETTIRSKDIIIATGSKIASIPIPGIDQPFVLNSTTALSYKKLPKSITIIGGGVIGMEFACIYANLGVEVSVVEYTNRVVGMVNASISDEIAKLAKAKKINIYTGAKVTKIEQTVNKEALVIFEKDEKENYLVSENVLVAIGREPNIEGLNLEKANIVCNENGKGIAVDDCLKTNVNHIYAIGDVNNKIQLAHVASHQGIIAIDNILGDKKIFDDTAIPNVIFTSPEIAMVGLTTEAAIAKGINIKVSRFPFAANGKALTMGESEGFIEITKDCDTNAIIGAGIIGADASALISSLTLIVQNNISEEQIVETVFAHPTTGEVIHEATLGLGIGALHFHE